MEGVTRAGVTREERGTQGGVPRRLHPSLYPLSLLSLLPCRAAPPHLHRPGPAHDAVAAAPVELQQVPDTLIQGREGEGATGKTQSEDLDSCFESGREESDREDSERGFILVL